MCVCVPLPASVLINSNQVGLLYLAKYSTYFTWPWWSYLNIYGEIDNAKFGIGVVCSNQIVNNHRHKNSVSTARLCAAHVF